MPRASWRVTRRSVSSSLAPARSSTARPTASNGRFSRQREKGNRLATGDRRRRGEGARRVSHGAHPDGGPGARRGDRRCGAIRHGGVRRAPAEVLATPDRLHPTISRFRASTRRAGSTFGWSSAAARTSSMFSMLCPAAPRSCTTCTRSTARTRISRTSLADRSFRSTDRARPARPLPSRLDLTEVALTLPRQAVMKPR